MLHSRKDRGAARVHARRWPDTLAGRLAAAIAIFVLFATAGVLGAGYVRGRETLLREAQQRLQARNRIVADRLERALRDRLRLVEVWPGLGAAQDLAVEDVDKRLAASLKELASSFAGTDLALGVAPDGRVIAASDPSWIGRDAAKNGWLDLLRRTAPPARLHVLPGGQAPGVLAVSPVFGPSGATLGWIAVVTPWSELIEEAAPDDPASLAVLTQSGREIAGAGDPGSPTSLRARQELDDVGGLRLQAAVTAPMSAALRPLRDTSRQLFTLAVVFIAIALPGAVWLARSTTRELRRLTVAAREAPLEGGAAIAPASSTAPREVRVLSDALRTMVGRLEESRHELARQESLAAMGMMAAALAHEIRTPLSVVSASAEMLARHAEPGTRDQELTSFILGEVERLGRLANDLLAFARPRTPREDPVDLAEIAAAVASGVASRFEEAEVPLRTELGPARVLGDADQLHQVCLNLLVNAQRASAAGRTVRLETGEDAGVAVLRVLDEGRGIAAEELERVWTPFFTTGGGGTGLGLPIVRRIVQAHGGEVTLRSEPGVGTVATVSLPLRSSA